LVIDQLLDAVIDKWANKRLDKTNAEYPNVETHVDEDCVLLRNFHWHGIIHCFLKTNVQNSTTEAVDHSSDDECIKVWDKL